MKIDRPDTFYTLENAAPSKEFGADVPIGSTVITRNNVYKCCKLKGNKALCKECDLQDPNPEGVIICRRLRCAWIYRQDRKNVVFKKLR